MGYEARLRPLVWIGRADNYRFPGAVNIGIPLFDKRDALFTTRFPKFGHRTLSNVESGARDGDADGELDPPARPGGSASRKLIRG